MPVKLSETNIEEAVEKVAKTVRMLEKMLEHKKHAITQDGHTEEELKNIRAKQTAAKTEPSTERKALLTQGTAEPTRKPPKESMINGERTTVPTEAVIKTSATNELKDDLEITVEKLTNEPAREPEPEAKTINVLKKKAVATKGLEPETGGRSQEEIEITIEKITPILSTAKPTDASVPGKTQLPAQPTTDNEPEAHIISVERIVPGRSTGVVTADDKKAAEELAQQMNDEALELAGKQPHKNKRTGATAKHAQSSQPTRQQAVIELTPTPDKKAINKEEEKLEHELEKEKLPKTFHPPTQVSFGTDRLVLLTGKSTIILKAPMTTAKQPTQTLKQTVHTVKPTTEKEIKVTERTLFSSKAIEGESLLGKAVVKTKGVKIGQTKGGNIADELQEELTNKHSLKIKTRKTGLHHWDETTTTTESTRKPAHNVEELEEELERQLKGESKMARVRKSQVDRDLEEDLKEIALH